MTILLVEIVCPYGHANGGALEQYASEEPPEAFLEDVSRKFYHWVKEHPAEFANCYRCQTPFSPKWQFTVSTTKCSTMEEAEAHLDKHAKRIETQGQPG